MEHNSRLISDIHTLNADVQMVYLNASLEETKFRHSTRSKASDFGDAELELWYNKAQPSNYETELCIPQSSSINETVCEILCKIGC